MTVEEYTALDSLEILLAVVLTLSVTYFAAGFLTVLPKDSPVWTVAGVAALSLLGLIVLVLARHAARSL